MPDSRKKGDILDRIVATRREALEKLGPTFGSPVPAHRQRALVPFLSVPGAILEIKRASPSKGDIAPDLDPAVLAHAYAAAGARNVSVLTERDFFRGSLEDLAAATAAEPGLAFLRKDFLLEEEEVEVSYRAGADAILLIARILEPGKLCRMAALARSFGMRPFIEVRETEDLLTLQAAALEGPVLSGVNARDLASFEIDPLIPASLRSSLPGDAVFESGIHSGGAAAYARNLGFQGILVGEAAAKDPARAASIVHGFLSASESSSGRFWREIAERRDAKAGRPLVKICGITRTTDALLAASLGADLLGFVFAESPRAADEQAVRATVAALSAAGYVGRKKPLLVGVITGTGTELAKAALSLASEGLLDAIQVHVADGGLENLLEDSRFRDIGRYAAVSLGNGEDVARVASLRASGEPRILVDSKVAGLGGGTGKLLPSALVTPLLAEKGLWLAGGLGPETVGAAIEHYHPELVDASSRLEASPGQKDEALLRSYFAAIEQKTGGLLNHV